MPSNNCRSQFTAYLRQHGIKYEIWPGHVDINHFRFHFLEPSQRIIIRCGYDVPFAYEINYAYPDTIIKKALAFQQCINQKFKYAKTFLVTDKVIRKKVAASKKVSEKRNEIEPVPLKMMCE